MKKVVTREHNKLYYRVLHVPIWLWVFFILPGHLTYDLFTQGFDRRHAVWLAIVFLVCAWRGWLGRLPGVEFAPYVTHYGADTPNLGYRVVCYTAAWIDLLVPFALNVIGVTIAAWSGQWLMADLYRWLYYPLALAIVVATWLNLTPRARRSTLNEGAERAWFYVAIWVVVPTQSVSWAVWRFGQKFGLHGAELGRANLLAVLLVGGLLAWLALRGLLPRTARYYFPESPSSAEAQRAANNASTGEPAD
jgi:hypothetical protein